MTNKTRSPSDARSLVMSIVGKNTFAHYGVLGMKWGVRKDRNSYRSKRASKRKADYSEMSDDELKQAINRLSMEKRYKELTAAKKSFGRRLVDSSLRVMKTSAGNVATKYTTKSIEKLVESTIKKLESMEKA